MEALVITLREGIEAALVLGLILTYLNRAGQQGLKPRLHHTPHGQALTVPAVKYRRRQSNTQRGACQRVPRQSDLGI